MPEFNNVIELKDHLNRTIKSRKGRVMRAMNAVMAEIVSWIKDNHTQLNGWNNQTHALEQSIQYRPVEQMADGTLRGTIYAGMEYAVYVEFREGHWVLSGGMNEFRDKIAQKIVEYF